ncbi:MAG: glucose 1-dehydrogenase [Planctomycetaceae bacterium]|nr:glucose 1-dehydrogenase [Planctomycetaceae bacterium]
MSRNLTGKVALVTGASKGIGAEIARRLAAEGAAVVVNYSSSQAAADHVVEDIVQAGGKAVAVQADVSKEADVLRLFAEAAQAFGRVDILVNNAGVYEFSPIEEMTEAQYRRMFDLNVLGLLFATREAVKQFGRDGGNIINIGSVAATSAPATGAVYSATKAAVDTITMSLAKELGPRKIRVNSVNPGMVETEGTQAQGITESDWADQIASQTPLRRIGQPNDIAPVVAFVASDDAGWVTGQTLLVSGGDR